MGFLRLLLLHRRPIPHSHQFHIIRKHIPNTARSFSTLQNASDMKERISMIEACLCIGQLPRAKHLYKSLADTSIVDVHVHNSFLDAFVSSFSPTSTSATTQFQELLGWFQNMKKNGIIPNLTSYAILLKGVLKSNLSNDFYFLVVQDMKRTLKDYPVNLDNLYESHVFDVDHVIRLKTIFNDVKATEKFATTSPAVVSSVQKLTTAKVNPMLANFPKVNPSISSNLEYVKKPLEAVTSSGETVEDQIAIEQESFRVNLQYLLDASETRRSATGIGILPPAVKRMASLWHKHYVSAVEQQIIKAKTTTQTSDKLDISPFLALFAKNPEKISVVVISQFLKAFGEGRPSARALTVVHHIGEGIEQEYKMMLLKNKKLREMLSKDYVKQQEFMNTRKLLDKNFRRLKALEIDHNNHSAFSFHTWERPLKVRIGSVLASWFMEIAKVKVVPADSIRPTDTVLEHAFKHDYVRENGKLYGVFCSHDIVQNALESTVNESGGIVVKGILLPKLLPMIIPPRPWLSPNSGGYITINTQLMRSDDPVAQGGLKEDILNGRLEKILNGIDVLSQTPWRVHSRILKYMITAWNTGKPVAGLPEEVFGAPPEQLPKPEDYETNPAARVQWYKANKAQTQKYYDMKGLRATENYKLEIARAFVGKTIYFPHNIDFRGRAYPIPQLFSHMGNDVARALLVFDKEKPLGTDGFKWLKIHFANVYGFDKCTFDDRERFVSENLEKIMKSAEDPFGLTEDHRFWEKGDKPWLTLSVAMEIADAVKSGNPEEFLSRLPIHQDGSCNGLQHYAALGGDLEGAAQVNLAPNVGGPQDVYTAVAEKVRELVEQDLSYTPTSEEETNSPLTVDTPAGRLALAKLLTPERIERKTVKQTVMTTVYGVTFIGAREQVRNRLKEKWADVYTPEQIDVLSRYITHKIFSSMNNMFKGAREIMNWFAASAREIARSVPAEELRVQLEANERAKELKRSKKKFGIVEDDAGPMENAPLNSTSSVSWTTLLGLTIVQPYKEKHASEVKTALQTFKIEKSVFKSPVNIAKQTAAFPPNFVHSLDATHMIMTALECQNAGIEFASVHDSYWTHACDIEQLRNILREQFVQMHSQPILENLANEFQKRYGNRKVLNGYVKGEMKDILIGLNQGQFKYKLNSAKGLIEFNGTQKNEGDENDETGHPNENTETNDLLLSNITDEEGILEVEDAGESESLTEDLEPTDKELGLGRKNQNMFKLWEDVKLPKRPDRGDFDVNEVKKSEYFFN